MISNSEISELLSYTADLSELHDGNPFKIKSYQSAAYRIDKMTTTLAALSVDELAAQPGIGKSIAAKIHEIATTGTLAELNELIEQTPAGVIDLFKVKGIGPKKIAFIWHNLGIESIGELLYACKENRLLQAKGFGQKTQQNIIDSIEFIFENAHKFHYYKVEKAALMLIEIITKQIPNVCVEMCGELRRKCETPDKIELVAGIAADELLEHLKSISFLSNLTLHQTHIAGTMEPQLPLIVYTCAPQQFAYYLWKHTGSDEHTALLIADENVANEADIYEANKLSFIPAELRENRGEIQWAAEGKLPELIKTEYLRGTLHNHTQYSDGKHSLREMALYAKQLGYEYLGVCDHSQSAQYAGGLKPDAVLKQFAEIDSLNKELAPFHIFKGIESDILGDGSLDYDDRLLEQFDFVVASVHSNLKMNEEKAMMRLMRAIENPYTTILGHPTGRLLLMREGYPIDHQKIIDACAANGVCIEINANPYRLDLDWRWINYAVQKNVMLSINPDAHEMEGYHDMYYGVCVARKGGLTSQHCLNTFSLDELDTYFTKKRRQVKPLLNG
ncbi:MAG: helix-hairpin-helix domain-containing protein [Bacteroidota bacterium]|jgi:DNA polymerase (family 10)